MNATIEIAPGNDGQLREWDGDHGAYWAKRADDYDASYQRYQPVFLAAIDAQPGERILDVGCGSGQVAIDLVRAVDGVTAVGVDLSSPQLEVARQRAGELPATFVQADAQVHDFGDAAYDAVVSRTGTMFFSDSGAAFANLARATRPGGRFVQLVWRGVEENAWLRELFVAIGSVHPMPSPPPGAPGPFALADPDRVRALLTDNGWAEPELRAVDDETYFGPDPDQATDFIVGQMEWLLSRLDDEKRRQAIANLHDVMAAHTRDDGVWLGSGAWIVSATRPVD